MLRKLSTQYTIHLNNYTIVIVSEYSKKKSQLWTLIKTCLVIRQTNRVEQKQYFFNKLHFTLKLANFVFLWAHSKSSAGISQFFWEAALTLSSLSL